MSTAGLVEMTQPMSLCIILTTDHNPVAGEDLLAEGLDVEQLLLWELAGHQVGVPQVA
jgi:hypothetical protein